MPALASPHEVLDRDAVDAGSGERQTGQRLFEPERATLDDRVSAVWEQLVADGRAECPVCEGDLRAGQSCADCGSELG